MNKKLEPLRSDYEAMGKTIAEMEKAGDYTIFADLDVGDLFQYDDNTGETRMKLSCTHYVFIGSTSGGLFKGRAPLPNTRVIKK